jgi:UDP-N-acetylglucosamine acyltransferase
MHIDSSSNVSPDAQIADDVIIGPYTIIGPKVQIESGVHIFSHVVIDGQTIIQKNCKIFPGAILGTPPQDLKYKEEDTKLIIGENSIIREYAMLNPGTKGGGGETIIGKNCFIMAYSHVAHDCHIGDNAILTNGVQLAGHVTIEHHAIISALTVIHQQVRVGAYAMIGGASSLGKDIVPYVRAIGHGFDLRISGLNSVGLVRNNFSEDVRKILKNAYKILFLANLNVSQAVERIKKELPPIEEIKHLISFIESSKRGIYLKSD